MGSRRRDMAARWRDCRSAIGCWSMPATCSSISSVPKCASTTTSRRCGARRSPSPWGWRSRSVRLALIAVGRRKPGPLKDLERHYAGRITWPLTIKEVEERRPLPPPELKLREAALLLGALPREAVAVALDARGTALSSAAFAARLAAWRDGGAGEVAFLIG